MVAGFLYFSDPDAVSLGVGLPLAGLGLALRGWAAGHLEKNHELARSGPYSYLRNPLYLGTLIVALGFAIASRRWELGLLFAVVFGCVYLPVIELEEQHLRSLFPGYEAYASRVGMLLPSGRLAGASRRFAWRLYVKNREYQAALGFLAGAAVLALKVVR